MAGVVFIAAGLSKFVFFGFELEQFERFGLPFGEAMVILAGVVELAGGIALLRRRFVVPAALALAGTMVVAITTSGLAQGDIIPSLTVAPALLVALVFLLCTIRAAIRPRAAQRGPLPPSRRSSSRS